MLKRHWSIVICHLQSVPPLAGFAGWGSGIDLAAMDADQLEFAPAQGG